MKFLDNNGLEYLADKITGLISGVGSADFIVEQGTSGIWTYRKWASGIAECWGAKSVTTAISTAMGSIYRNSSEIAKINYPFTFTTISKASIECKNYNCWFMRGSEGSMTQTDAGYIARPTADSAGTNAYKIQYHTIGTWKTFTPTAAYSNPSSDFIFERGTSGIWVYRKWNSGLAECWGVWGGQLTHYATVASGLYGYYTTMGLPAIFDSSVLPVIQVTAGVGAGFAWSGAYMPNSYTGTSFNIYAVSGLSGTQTVTFNMSVKGRWKPW